ncbi:PspA/IM30 family protein [Aeromicrobium sp.]|uniref:PspA/IM30 family protein n=1 Tax=Aeromicrobium sp. TaxID=1871063 RepID=UPI0035110BBF|nr:PspA/IM30 family protein [Propionibacteriales bacterium]
MGIGRRIRDIWRSRSHRELDGDALRSSLDDTYRAQLAHLQKVRRGVADVTTSRKRVEVRLRQLEQQAATFDAQAREAVERGDDTAARTALGRKVGLEDSLADLRERHAALQQEEATITDAATRLEDSIEDFRLRKDTLTARASAAEARSQLTSADTGIASSLSSVNQQMEAAERHTRELEARADAVDELVADGIVARPGESSDDLEARRFDRELGLDVPHGTEVEGEGRGPQQVQG